MKYLFPLILIHLFCFCLFSQEISHRSIHELQNIEYSGYNFKTENEYDKQGEHRNFPKDNSLALSKQVFGWYPYWLGTAYTSLNYNLLSSIAYFSYEVDTATGGYTSIHSWRTTPLVGLAHSYNVKVVLTVTNFGTAGNISILSSTTKRQVLIDSIISLIQFRSADGVNIDFESVPFSQRNNLSTFMILLSNQVHTMIPGSKVSIALPPVDWTNAFDVVSLNSSCDYLIIMGYDYYWSGSTYAGPNAPLQNSQMWGNYSSGASVNYYLNGITSSKLMLGVPYYGYQWPTISGTIHSQTTGTGTAYSYASMKPRFLFHGRIWDSNSMTPWTAFDSTSWFQDWYEDSVSLGFKYDLVNADNLGGIGIWALGYDGTYNEFWNEIAYKFGIVGISNNKNSIPSGFELFQNYPNPFNPITIIKFVVPSPSQSEMKGQGGEVRVSLRIYDILGRDVATPVNGQFQPGTYEVKWGAENFSSGIYYCELQAGSFRSTKKMVLLK